MSTTPEPVKEGGCVTPTMPDEVRDAAREASGANDLAFDGSLPARADAAAEVAYAAGRADGLAEGERRERARAVAWLRGSPQGPLMHVDTMVESGDRIERGEHLDD